VVTKGDGPGTAIGDINTPSRRINKNKNKSPGEKHKAHGSERPR